MLDGHLIANRIEFLMNLSPATSKTEVGALLTPNKTASPQAQRKRYASLLRHLRDEKIIAELRIVAGYLGVTIEFLIFGERTDYGSISSSGDVVGRSGTVSKFNCGLDPNVSEECVKNE